MRRAEHGREQPTEESSMASVPLKTISNLYKSARNHRGDWVRAGRCYSANYKDGKFQLVHYGTLILYTDENARQYQIGAGAWSQSDRDAINTIMHILGTGKRARILKGELISEGAGWTEYTGRVY